MKNWLRVSVLLGLFAPAGSAVDWTALKPQGYVSDFANVIDAASKSQLEAYCATVEGSTGAQMALVTIATLEGEPIEDVANTIYRAWGVGQKGKNEGVLLLLVVRVGRGVPLLRIHHVAKPKPKAKPRERVKQKVRVKVR